VKVLVCKVAKAVDSVAKMTNDTFAMLLVGAEGIINQRQSNRG
jgi:hypothetical protein